MSIKGSFSRLFPVKHRVQQGFILGPLLYRLFTNELPEVVHDHLHIKEAEAFLRLLCYMQKIEQNNDFFSGLLLREFCSMADQSDRFHTLFDTFFVLCRSSRCSWALQGLAPKYNQQPILDNTVWKISLLKSPKLSTWDLFFLVYLKQSRSLRLAILT